MEFRNNWELGIGGLVIGNWAWGIERWGDKERVKEINYFHSLLATPNS